MVWLLLLVLPLQGYAAATMLNCGPLHHHSMAALIAHPHETHEMHGMHGMHEPAAAARHHHETDRDGGQHEVPSANDGSEASSLPHVDKLDKFKCNACAVCCISAAMPCALFTFDPFPPTMTLESFVPTAHVGFVTDGPDRPPRLSHV